MSIATDIQAKPKAPSKSAKYTLDSTHRCDRDGAQAYVKVVFISGNHLLFCRHDYLELKPVMEAQGIIDNVVDETAKLVYDRHTGTENS